MAKKTPRQVRARTRPDAAEQQLQQQPPPGPPVRATPRGNQRWDSLRSLEHAVSDLRAAEALRDREVRRARSQGATWTEISRVLGVSPQAVQQRYGTRASQ